MIRDHPVCVLSFEHVGARRHEGDEGTRGRWAPRWVLHGRRGGPGLVIRDHRVCVLSFERVGALRRVGGKGTMGAGNRPWNGYRTMTLGGGSALGFGFGHALDTDRHRMWTDISDTHRLLDVDRHFVYVPRFLDVDRHFGYGLWMWTDIRTSLFFSSPSFSLCFCVMILHL